MSIVAFKKKSVVQHGTHVSGRSPGGAWIPRGPGKKLEVSTVICVIEVSDETSR